MEFLRRKNLAQRGSSESSVGEKKPLPPNTTPSPFSLAPSLPTTTTTTTTPPNPPSNLKPTPRVRPPLPNTDPLPTDPGLLEGLLNHHASQLKKLADRTESVNEWIEMDGIVLARLVDEMTLKIEREKARERAEAVASASGNPTTPPYRAIYPQPGPRSPTVRFNTPGTPEARPPPEAAPTTEERVSSNSSIYTLRDRIRSMKKWRKELERSVVWQRGEYEQIEKVRGKKTLDTVPEEGEGVGGAWGVGGKTWERGSGRLPTQMEWEVMFGPERLGWDENGARPRS